MVSWIGSSDLIAAKKNEPEKDPGPVLRLARHPQHGKFDRIHLLNDFQPGDSTAERGPPKATFEEYCPWLAQCLGKPSTSIVSHQNAVNLRNKIGPAYEATKRFLTQIRGEESGALLAMLLSPGVPAMGVAMILASQLELKGQAALYNAFDPKDGGGDGVDEVTLPFDLQGEVFQDLTRQWRQPVNLSLHQAFAEDGPIKGGSAALQRAKQQAQQVAPFAHKGVAVSVLLLGETGTGKELFARAIHDASGRSGLFKAINCGAIPETLAESELFGHERGAFTGATTKKVGAVALADTGTLFLDEIGDLPGELQVKLLRFLNDGTYLPVGATREVSADVRVIAATHLYMRLNDWPIHLPPLRARRGDIPILGLCSTISAVDCWRGRHKVNS